MIIKKRFRRNRCLQLVSLLLISLVFCFAQFCFADVSYSPWAKAYIEDSIKTGLISPELQNSYLSNINRQEFSALIVNMLEKHMENKLSYDGISFDDTEDINVLKAAKIGIVNGTDKQLFDPQNLLSREQAATIIIRAYEYISPGITKNLNSSVMFKDNNLISTWAKEYVTKANALTLLSGYDNTINPKGFLTREQAIAIVKRLYDKLHPETATKYTPAVAPTKFELDKYFGTNYKNMKSALNTFYKTTKTELTPYNYEVYVLVDDVYTGIILGGLDFSMGSVGENFNVVVFDTKTNLNKYVTVGGINLYSKLSDITKIYGTKYELSIPTFKPDAYSGEIDDKYSIRYSLGYARELLILANDKEFNDIYYIKFMGSAK